MLKRITIFSGLMLILILFKGLIFNFLIKYKPINSRTAYSLNNELIEYLDVEINIKANDDIESFILMANKITGERLQFTFDKCSVDPNVLVKSQKTHCVGYAHFFVSTFNHLANQSDLHNSWKAEAYVGQLYFLGVNVHSFIKSPFFKDHDFVIVENTHTKDKILVDPSLYDYLRINIVKQRGVETPIPEK